MGSSNSSLVVTSSFPPLTFARTKAYISGFSALFCFVWMFLFLFCIKETQFLVHSKDLDKLFSSCYKLLARSPTARLVLAFEFREDWEGISNFIGWAEEAQMEVQHQELGDPDDEIYLYTFQWATWCHVPWPRAEQVDSTPLMEVREYRWLDGKPEQPRAARSGACADLAPSEMKHYSKWRSDKFSQLFANQMICWVRWGVDRHFTSRLPTCFRLDFQ